jgi:hypothetical protein
MTDHRLSDSASCPGPNPADARPMADRASLGMPGHGGDNDGQSAAVPSAVMRSCLNKDRDGHGSIGSRLPCPPALCPWATSPSGPGYTIRTGDFRRPAIRCSRGESLGGAFSTNYLSRSRPINPGIGAMAYPKSRTYNGPCPVTWRRHPRVYGLNRHRANTALSIRTLCLPFC